MATFSVAAFTPASPITSGGASAGQTSFNGTLVANTAQTVITGFKTTIGISLSGATDAVAAAGVHVKFGSALKAPTAASTDFFLPPGAAIYYFDMGSEFDRVSIISAGTPNFFVYVFSNK